MYLYVCRTDSKQKMVQMVSKGSLEKGQSILRGPLTQCTEVRKFNFLLFSFVLSSLAFDFYKRNFNLATTFNSIYGKFACQMSHSFHDKDI